MKRILSGILSLFLLLSLCIVPAAGSVPPANVQIYNYIKSAYEPAISLKQVSVLLEGTPLLGDMPAVNHRGRTMIPIRAVAEGMGAQVDWVPEYHQVVLRREVQTIVLTLGSAEALVNGLPTQLPDSIPAVTMRTPDGSERTMVPLRFVSEQLGATVNWDNATATASITAPMPPSPDPEVTSSPTPKPTYFVTDIKLDSAVQTVRILTQGQGGYTSTTMEGGRLVLDFPGAVLNPGAGDDLVFSNESFAGVRYAQHGADLCPGFDTAVRVVLDLKPNVNCTITDISGGLLIRTSTQKFPTATVPLNPQNITIALDAGHGGKASGATYNKIMEKIPALQMTRRLETLFLDMGYNVVMTRPDDSFVTLNDRCKIANDAKADLFVSIHLNAFEGNSSYEGFLVCPYVGSEEGARFATLVGNAACAATGAKNRGYRGENFAVTRGTDMTAILIETGFMSSPAELKRLVDNSYQQKLMGGVAEGIVQYLNEVQGREKIPDPPHPSGPPSAEGA
ncbi:MAG: N-acetylmuramoyl-L-alanine amidase family protein [Oscillospiraceae bacterium]